MIFKSALLNITFASHCTANQWYRKSMDCVMAGQDQSVSGSGVYTPAKQLEKELCFQLN